jgi:protein-disulfide isomerase
MNRSVAIVLALVVIVAGGIGAYVAFGNRGPETAGTATAPATSTEVPAAGSAATTTAPATTTTADASSAPAATAPAATTGAAPTATADATTQQAVLQPVIRPEDHVLGKADAPVTIIEYASMTCPHCAAFHAETMPKLKSEFIDKGKVRLVFRPFPLNQLALRASLLAECVPGDGYFELIGTMFAGQKEWMEAQNPLDSLRAMGKSAGIEEGKIDGCMTDDKKTQQIAAAYKEAVDTFGVNATPSFIINGTKFAGALPFDDLVSGDTKVQGLASIIRGLLPQ